MSQLSIESKELLIKNSYKLTEKMFQLEQGKLTKEIIAECEKDVKDLIAKFPDDDESSYDKDFCKSQQYLESSVQSLKETFINQVSPVQVYDGMGGYILDDNTEEFDEDCDDEYPEYQNNQIDY